VHPYTMHYLKKQLLVFLLAWITMHGTAQPSPNAQPFGFAKDSFYTNIGNVIYKMGRISTTWIYAFDLPFVVAKEDVLRMPDESHILVIQKDTNLIYYHLQSATVQNTTAKKILENFVASKITEISFETTLSNCFNNSKAEDVYILNKDNEYTYASSKKLKNPAKLRLPKNEETIEAFTITNFLKELPDFIHHKVTMAELGFSEANYEQCKKDILDYRANKRFAFYVWDKANVNFDRLINMVDSVKNISPEKLNTYLYHIEEIIATFSRGIGIKFKNEEGQELFLGSSHASKANTFGFPWNLYLNGYTIKGNWLELSTLLQKIYPSLLPKADKIKILHSLVKKL
jgi:hypothetical protein